MASLCTAPQALATVGVRLRCFTSLTSRKTTCIICTLSLPVKPQQYVAEHYCGHNIYAMCAWPYLRGAGLRAGAERRERPMFLFSLAFLCRWCLACCVSCHFRVECCVAALWCAGGTLFLRRRTYLGDGGYHSFAIDLVACSIRGVGDQGSVSYTHLTLPTIYSV